MDTVTGAIIESIKAAGCAVAIQRGAPGWRMTALEMLTNEAFLVSGGDEYETACEPAGQVGIELNVDKRRKRQP